MEKKKYETVRLKTTNYSRPNTTITDSLQDEDSYREKLKNYKPVDDIDYVTEGTHVRYFKYEPDEKTWKFRTGGILTKKHEKYVVLSNGKYSWSVQRQLTVKNHKTQMGGSIRSYDKESTVYETKFFKILSPMEKKDLEIKKLEEQYQKVLSDNKKLAEKCSLLIQNFKGN